MVEYNGATVRDYSLDRMPQTRPELEKVLDSDKALTVTKTGNALSIASLLSDGKSIVVNATVSGGSNAIFNFVNTTMNGVEVHWTGDDVAPIRTQLGTLGGNHGFPLNIRAWAPANHNKTVADLGSVWTDGTREYVLLAINSSGQAIVGADYTIDGGGVVRSPNMTPTANLTHVSGATNTADFNYTLMLGLAVVQLYPTVARITQTLLIDGAPVVDGISAGNEFEVRETYEVLDYASLYTIAKANVGIPYSTLSVAGTVRVESNYKFRKGCVASLDVALTEIKPTELAACNFTQSVVLAGAVTRYLPGVKTIGGFNWSTGVNMGTYSVSQNIALADLQSSNIPPVMSLDVGTEVAFALGIKPWSGDATANAARIAETPTQLWDMRNSKKSYPGVVIAQATGWGRYSSHCFRAYLSTADAAKIAAIGTDSMGAYSTLFNSTLIP